MSTSGPADGPESHGERRYRPGPYLGEGYGFYDGSGPEGQRGGEEPARYGDMYCIMRKGDYQPLMVTVPVPPATGGVLTGPSLPAGGDDPVEYVIPLKPGHRGYGARLLAEALGYTLHSDTGREKEQDGHDA